MSITPNSPLEFAAIPSVGNAGNYNFYGMAQVTNGLVQITQVNGIGLLTGGFIWQAPEFWFDTQSVQGLATGWTAAIGYAGSTSVITTTWIASSAYGQFENLA